MDGASEWRSRMLFLAETDREIGRFVGNDRTFMNV